MQTLCLYHSVDLDGWMSAAIVKHHFIVNNPKCKVKDNLLFENDRKYIQFQGYTYGDKVPDITSYDRIIMCDMSLLKTVMEQLHENHTKEIIWIDHHYSAIHDSELPLKYNDLKGIRDTKFAACELTWKYYFPNDSMPEIVRLLGRYDCFGHRGTSEEIQVLEFQYGARSSINNYNTAYYFLLCNIEDDAANVIGLEHIINHLYHEGKIIYEYLCQDAELIYNTGIDINLEGFKFRLINKERFNPINFNIDYHKHGYDAIACFWLSPKDWHFSLYNDNNLVDVSAIAKQFGGGGHKGAAGFILSNGEHIDSFINARRI